MKKGTLVLKAKKKPKMVLKLKVKTAPKKSGPPKVNYRKKIA